MAVDLTFAGAFIDGSSDASGANWSNVRILGHRLRKFSLWHRVLLRTVESPFAKGKGNVTMWDIRVLVGICELPFGNSDVSHPWLMPFLLRLRAALSVLIPFRGRALPGQPNAQERALAALRDQVINYCGDYLQEPVYSIRPPETDGKARKSQLPAGRAPDELEQVSDIVGYTHWPQEYVWNMPIGQANWWRAMAIRAAGNDIDFVDSKDKAFQDKLGPEFRHKKPNGDRS